MAKSRTGAPTWALILQKACKLSHTPGFNAAATLLLGEDASTILAAWTTFCTLFEAFVSQDDWPFQTDFTAPFGPGDVS